MVEGLRIIAVTVVTAVLPLHEEHAIDVEESRGIDLLDWLRDSVVEGSELQVMTDIWHCFVGHFHLDKLEFRSL